tara:strand:+ start:767 stop:1417 length:651 start_codon:yes stop_codon:yes gene_type:complete
MPCCGRKKGVDDLFNKPKSFINSLDKGCSKKFIETRSIIKYHPKFSKRFKECSLSALSLYTGNMYSKEFKNTIRNNLDKKFDLLIMSAGYGFVRPDEVIESYNIEMRETYSYWKKCLPNILMSYLKSKDITEVEGVFSASGAYIKVARAIQNYLKLNSSVQFRIISLDYDRNADKENVKNEINSIRVPKLQSKLLLKLFEGKTPDFIEGVPVKIET